MRQGPLPARRSGAAAEHRVQGDAIPGDARPGGHGRGIRPHAEVAGDGGQVESARGLGAQRTRRGVQSQHCRLPGPVEKEVDGDIAQRRHGRDLLHQPALRLGHRQVHVDAFCASCGAQHVPPLRVQAAQGCVDGKILGRHAGELRLDRQRGGCRRGHASAELEARDGQTLDIRAHRQAVGFIRRRGRRLLRRRRSHRQAPHIEAVEGGAVDAQPAADERGGRPIEPDILTAEPDALRIRDFQALQPQAIREAAGQARGPHRAASHRFDQGEQAAAARIGVRGAQHQEHENDRQGDQHRRHPGKDLPPAHQKACPMPT